MKVGVLGSGQVGEVLADGFLKHGYEVMRGSRNPPKLAKWLRGAGKRAQTGTFAETALFGDMVVLAVKGEMAVSAVRAAGVTNLADKTVIDATNPIGEAPPDQGVLQFFTTLRASLMERLQETAPRARFVKAFSCVGAGMMVNPVLSGGPPSMFICGDDEAAKEEVGRILRQFGWEPEDMGAVQAARAIEPLCMLWCIPGFRAGQWQHAFKLLRPPPAKG